MNYKVIKLDIDVNSLKTITNGVYIDSKCNVLLTNQDIIYDEDAGILHVPYKGIGEITINLKDVMSKQKVEATKSVKETHIIHRYSANSKAAYCKLSPEDVTSLYRDVLMGMTQTNAGKKYGITQSGVSQIMRKQRFADLTDKVDAEFTEK